MTKHNGFLLMFLLMFGLLAVVSQPVFAQDPQPTPSDNEVNRVAKQMYCPVCENIPLDVCPTQACAEWRELIRLKLSEGWTDQQIKDYFAAQYGDRVLAEPPRRGWNWLVYVLPWVFLAAGALLVWRVLVSLQRRTKTASPTESAVSESDQPAMPNQKTAAPQDDPYLAKLEEELRKSK